MSRERSDGPMGERLVAPGRDLVESLRSPPGCLLAKDEEFTQRSGVSPERTDLPSPFPLPGSSRA